MNEEPKQQDCEYGDPLEDFPKCHAMATSFMKSLLELSTPQMVLTRDTLNALIQYHLTLEDNTAKFENVQHIARAACAYAEKMDLIDEAELAKFRKKFELDQEK